MTARRQAASDLDSPWKEALERFLRLFLAFFFPRIHERVTWERGYQSLDKELQQVVRGARIGRRLADKLFQVWDREGREAWLLIHIEIQGRRVKDFPEQLYVYNYRIYDRYRRRVASLAVLCDDAPSWRPDRFGYNVGEFSLDVHFPVVKLLDYRGREAELEADANPFAAVVLAHLKLLETRWAPEERRRWKLRLIQGLYRQGLKAEDVRQLFRLLDWMMQLPEELEEGFWAEMTRFEEERRMPYVTSVERLALKRGRKQGREEGRQEGLREGVLEGIGLLLEAKFGAAGKRLLSRLREREDVEQMRTLARALKSAATVDDARRLINGNSG